MTRDKLIVLLGPTAVGKTKLSIQLAKKFDTDIISGDSMLVYRGFDIGSAKPSLKEQEGVRHFLIDILDAGASFSVMDFQERAAACIREINRRGRIPVLAGGTGLYIKSLLEGYCFNKTPGSDAFRQRYEALAAEKGKEYVHSLLKQVDPAAAERLHSNDFRRVVRALEVFHLGQENISQQKAEFAYDAYVVGLYRERAELYQRINARVDAMFAAGLEEEVRKLLRQGVSRSSQAMQGIGYKETASFLQGEITRAAAVTQIQQATRHFAKRQLTWYRKMPYVHWYDVGSLSEDGLLCKVYEDSAGYFARR